MIRCVPKVALGAISLDGRGGGIARLAQLVAKVLVEEHQAGALNLRMLTFQDSNPSYPVPIVRARESKLRFALAALRAGWTCRHFIYDACHLAQVHRLPGMGRHRYLSFLCGIELWEHAKPSYVRAARQAALLLAISRFTLEKAEHCHGRFPRARVCWLGTETDDLPVSSRHSNSSPPQALIVSRLGELYKGHRELIACWPRVNAAVPDAVLCIVGDGPDGAALRALAAQSPVAERIVFKGSVSDAELEDLYGRSSLFCMPSRGEGFGLVYIEAMRHGLPVIASVHDAAVEIVLDGQTGYTANLDRPEELPERLIDLLSNPERARTMGQAGQRRWTEQFRYSAFRERFRPLLREFLQL
jgi:phosphatidyl-myo-inositol dimannoside synthase